MQGVISLRKRLPTLIIAEQAHELNVFRLKEEVLFAFWPAKWVTFSDLSAAKRARAE